MCLTQYEHCFLPLLKIVTFNPTFGKRFSMAKAKKKVYQKTTVAQAKAAVLKSRSAKKKASREARSGKTHAPKA
jgi:hypothetical protein